jgi:Flp pilus assembly protein TadG
MDVPGVPSGLLSRWDGLTWRRPVGVSGTPARTAAQDAAMKRPGLSTAARRQDHEGQALVEFALILPIFLVLLMALLEFAFVLNAVLNTNYASRNAALLAAEAGSAAGADCVILQSIENDMTAPTRDNKIVQVEVFRADHNGNPIGTGNLYVRSGSTTCQYPSGPDITVPYSLSTSGYPESQRCNYLGGCPALGRTELDMVGVSITYDYAWHTPLQALLQWLPGHGTPSGPGLSGSGYTIVKSNCMRMEPVL